jgi:DNA-binding MarR family transcriptional regulator
MFALASYMLRSASMGTFNTIAELDLSLTQIKVLCALEMDGQERSVKALAESMGVSLPAMSRAVDGLFDRGFVTRDEDPLSGLRELMGSLADDEAQALGDALTLILERHPEIAAHRPDPPAAQAPDAKEADR